MFHEKIVSNSLVLRALKPFWYVLVCSLPADAVRVRMGVAAIVYIRCAVFSVVCCVPMHYSSAQLRSVIFCPGGVKYHSVQPSDQLW